MNGIIYMKKYWLIGLILILTATSWIGFIDKYSNDYTYRSMLEAGAAYGISRGLNAAISVAQTSTIEGGVGIVGGSITVGEVLDPLNDLIERFSQVMTISLGSIALQTILLEIASNTFFKLLCTVSGLVVITVILLKKTTLVNHAVRIFFILILIRLSMAIVLSANGVVDYAFIHEKIKSSKSEMELLRSNVENLSDKKTQIEEIINVHNNQLKPIEKQKSSYEKELEKLTSTIDSEKKDLKNEIEKLDLADKVKCKANLCPDYISAIKHKIEELEEKSDRIKKPLKNLNQQIDGIQDEISDLTKALEGNEPWYLRLKGFDIKPSLMNLQNNISNGINNIITLLMLFILKTILIPIGFWYIFYKTIKSTWSHNWRETLDSYDKAIDKI